MQTLKQIFNSSCDVADIYKLTYKLVLSHINTNIENPKTIFDLLNECLKEKNIQNKQNQTALLRAITKAYIQKDEESIYQDIEQINILKGRINDKKEALKHKIYDIFESFEVQSELLDEAKIYDIEILGILSQTMQSAIISILEQGVMVEEKLKNITSDMFYITLYEGEIDNYRAAKISKNILNPAFEIANEWKNYTQIIVTSVVFGIYDGIFRAIERLKKEVEYETLQERARNNALKFIGFENKLIQILRELSLYDTGASRVLSEILQNNLDTKVAKLTRSFGELKDSLSLKILSLKNNDTILGIKKDLEIAQNNAKNKYNEICTKDAKNIGEKLAQNTKKIFEKFSNK